MRNLIITMLLLLFSNCNGYQPIFDSSGLNFYLKEITLKDNSSISRDLSKRLESLRLNTEKKPLIIEFKSSKTDNIAEKLITRLRETD